MSSSVAPPSSRRSSLLKHPLIILGGLLILLVGIASMLYFRDDAPPDDSSLRPRFTTGGGADNPLAVFSRELEKLTLADPFDQAEDVRMGNASPEVMEAAMTEILAANSIAFPLVERLAQTNPQSWRWPDREQNLPWKFADSATSKRLSSVKYAYGVHASRLVKKGDAAEAVRIAVMLVRMARDLHRAEALVLHQHYARMLQNSAEGALRVALVPDATDSLLLQAQTRLGDAEIQCDDLILAVQAEHMAASQALRDVAAGKLRPEALNGGYQRSTLYFRANRTVAELTQLNQRLVEGLQEDWPAAIRAQRTGLAITKPVASSRQSMIPDPNSTGKELLKCLWWSCESAVNSSVERVAKHRMSMLMLALRRFELRHARLPERLAELVPEFIASVPLDPHDNQPVRWDYGTQSLCGVGVTMSADGKLVVKTDPYYGARYWWAKKEEPTPEPARVPPTVARKPILEALRLGKFKK